MSLEQNIGREPATAGEALHSQLQEYRLGIKQAEAKTGASPAGPGDSKSSAPVDAAGSGYTDKGSSADDLKIRNWKPDHGHGKNGHAWTAAMHKNEKEPVAGSYYDVQKGDCLESIARRALRTQHHVVNHKSTEQGVAKLIELNKEHYKSLTANPDFIKDGWKLRLSAAELKASDVITSTPATAGGDAAAKGQAAPPAADTVIDSKAKIETPAPAAEIPVPVAKALPDLPPAAPQKPDAPKPDAPKLEASKSDLPKSDLPKSDVSKSEAPPEVPKSSGITDRLYNFGKSVCDDTEKELSDHKWLVGAAAVVGVAAFAYAGRGKLKELFTAEKELSSTAQILERDAVLAKVGPIPDVVRPELTSLVTTDVPREFEKAAGEYRTSLSSLRQLPSHYELGESESASGLAERILKERSPITGERINPDVIAKEAERISGLNPELSVATAGAQILVHDEASIAKLAETTQFKHVPQMGQLLKQYGVSEENVQEAFKIQGSYPPGSRPLIGQVLVDGKLATKEQVDQAFEQQNSLKAILKEIRMEGEPK